MGLRASTLAAAALTALLASVTPALAVSSRQPAALPSPAPLVCIDPGHGGVFSNANANGLHERTVNLGIALELRKTLLARGYRVIMTHATDRAVELGDIPTWNQSRSGVWSYAKDHVLWRHDSIPHDDLTARTQIANNAGADLFIAIHSNGSKSHKAHGTEVWVSPKDRPGMALAKLVQPAVVKRTKFKNRGVFTTDFYVLRWTNMPAILIESGFLTNKSDAAKLKRASLRRTFATGIAEGVDKWFASKPLHSSATRVAAASPEAEAIALSRASFPTTAPTVVLVRSDRAAEAPGAAVLAVRHGASLLESAKSVPSTDTLNEITRLGAKRILLVGVTGSFDLTGTAAALTPSGVPTSALELVEAADPVGLSAVVASQTGYPGSGRVALVNVRDTAAAMALVPFAARTGMPILLTADAAAAPAAAYIASFSGSVKQVLRIGSRYSPAPVNVAATVQVQTIRCADPAQIAYQLALFSPSAPDIRVPLVVNSMRPADVVAACVRGARLHSPVLTIANKVLSPYTRLFIANRTAKITGFVLVDSGGSLPLLVDAELAKCSARSAVKRQIASTGPSAVTEPPHTDEPLEGRAVRVVR